MPTTSNLELEVSRDNGDSYFSFSVPNSLQEIFHERSEDVKQSVKWPGLKFYSVPTILESQEYKKLLSDYNLFDNFGKDIVNESNQFNIAWLRTVGGNGRIKLNRDLPFAAVAERVRNITRFLKAYYEEFLSDYKVTGSLNITL